MNKLTFSIWERIVKCIISCYRKIFKKFQQITHFKIILSSVNQKKTNNNSINKYNMLQKLWTFFMKNQSPNWSEQHFSKCNNEKWKHKDGIYKTKNEIKIILHFVSKEHEQKHQIHSNKEKPHKGI